MDVKEMTREDFEAVPECAWDKDIGEFDSLIILPAKAGSELHDSGYRAMSFIAVKDAKPLYKLSGCSDVIHLDGIGGFGKDWLEKIGKVPVTVKPSGWSMDCLPISGLLRLFSSKKLTVGLALSSFEIFT